MATTWGIFLVSSENECSLKNVTSCAQVWCLEIKRTLLLANSVGIAHNHLAALPGLWVSLSKLETNKRGCIILVHYHKVILLKK